MFRSGNEDGRFPIQHQASSGFVPITNITGFRSTYEYEVPTQRLGFNLATIITKYVVIYYFFHNTG